MHGMRTTFLCDREPITLCVPDAAHVYEPRFPSSSRPGAQMVMDAIRAPLGADPLAQALRQRRCGDVVVVVSDITRPIPYASFLPEVLSEIESAGVSRDQILILIATGMHRPSTADEHRRMFGDRIVGHYRIGDHDAEADDLVELPVRMASGTAVRLNRRFVQAGFRLLTGLVEPHFMAGFSGGRKSVCPGLADLATIRQFHGYRTLASPMARNAMLDGNPCHVEALSAARQAQVDFTLNVVLNRQRETAAAFAGELEQAHAAACQFAASCVCPKVREPADVVITSSGGYPLDATFYQCVKGFVSCLPAVKAGGTIIAFGGCREGIGSPEYTRTMAQYSGNWQKFLCDIADGRQFTKDQWQYQMHCRTLAKVGRENLHFITPGLGADRVGDLSVTLHSVSGTGLGAYLQDLADKAISRGATLAVLPEGPYCAPTSD